MDKANFRRYLQNRYFPDKFFLGKELAVGSKTLSKLLDHQDEIWFGSPNFSTTVGQYLDYLKDHALDERPGNLTVPVVCTILSTNKPFGEWGSLRYFRQLQGNVYNMTESERREFHVGTSAADQEEFHRESPAALTIRKPGIQSVNRMTADALNMYDGVITKVANRNERAQQKLTRINDSRRLKGLPELPAEKPIEAFGANGKLINPPGKKNLIYVVSEDTVRPLTEIPEAPISSTLCQRLAIQKGQPGYIPDWQRPGLSTKPNKRLRRPYCTANRKAKRPGPNGEPKRSKRSGALCRPNISPERQLQQWGQMLEEALPVKITVADGTVIVDVRALLRSATNRGLLRVGASIEDVLALFTGNPVIDPQRNVVTFCYKSEELGVIKRSLMDLKAGRRAFDTILAADNFVAIACHDLGVTNPVASKVYKVGEDRKWACSSEKAFLPQYLLNEVAALSQRHDGLEKQVERASFLALSPEQQAEVSATEHGVAEVTKRRLIEFFGACGVSDAETIVGSLPLDRQAGGNSQYIAAALANHGVDSEKYCYISKGKKECIRIKYDQRFADDLKPRVSSETSKARQDARREFQRNSTEYQSLAKQKKELCRRIWNHLDRWALRVTGCRRVIHVIEDLTVNGGFFDGKGKRLLGWSNLFTYKKENRWFIKPLHTTGSERTINRGAYVVEVPPYNTSQRCPMCGHIDCQNRNGQHFLCLHCQHGKDITVNTDLDVAPHNIMHVFMTGKAIARPAVEKSPKSGDTKASGERSNDKRIPGSTRNCKSVKTLENLTGTKDSMVQPSQTG